MTNKEAISNLEHIYGIVSSDIQISLDLAIKALEGADDVCEKCKYVDRLSYEFPCNECAYAYEDHFTELKGGEEE